MPLTASERKVIEEIKEQVILTNERQKNQLESQDKIKIDVKRLQTTVYENGLNSRVKEIYEWVQEKKSAEQNAAMNEDKQEHEIKMLGVKVTTEMRQNIYTGMIAGSFTLLGIILSK